MAITVRENSGLMNGIQSRDGRYVLQGVAQKLARTYLADYFACQLLCADPSPLRIPELISYLSSELPKSSSAITVPESLRSQLVECDGWLFPAEVDMIINNDTGHMDWEKGIPLLLQKVDMMSADEGREENGKKLASAPIGLKNRWRIWNILQGIRVDSETYC